MKLPIQAQPIIRKFSTAKTSIVSGITPSVDVPAGPIWNNDDAKIKCPAVCTAVGRTWSGGWTTTIWGQMSVCGSN